MNFFELSRAYQQILDFETATDGQAGAFDLALAQLSDAIEDKAENIAKVIRSLEAEAEAFDNEAKRLAEQAKVRRNKVDRLKEYLLLGLTAAGKDRVKGALFTVAVQDSPPRCEVMDAGSVPDVFQVVIPATMRVDAKAIIQHFRDTGEQVPGAVVSAGKHLRIR